MAEIKKIYEDSLVGGKGNTEVYPVTSTKAVYNETNESLDEALKYLNTSYTFKGIATWDTIPDSTDKPIFYIATSEGGYSYFDNIVLEQGETCILLKENGKWIKKPLGVVSQEKYDSNEVFLTEDEYEKLAVKKEGVKYFTYEE